MGKIDKFTKSQLSTLKKRVKTLREQVKDVKEGEGNTKMTQVSHLPSLRMPMQEPFLCIISLEHCAISSPRLQQSKIHDQPVYLEGQAKTLHEREAAVHISCLSCRKPRTSGMSSWRWRSL